MKATAVQPRLAELAWAGQEIQPAAMSSNTTQAKALSILHRAKVADYAAWSLFVTCRPCDAPRTVPLATLPPDLTIIQALMRMRCRTCRGRVEAAILDNNLSGWRGWAVRVWGPGSYG